MVCGAAVSDTAGACSSLIWFGFSGVVALVVVVVVVVAAAATAAAAGRLLLGWDCSLESREMDVGVPGTAYAKQELNKRNTKRLLDTYVCQCLDSAAKQSHRPGRAGAPSCGVPKQKKHNIMSVKYSKLFYKNGSLKSIKAPHITLNQI